MVQKLEPRELLDRLLKADSEAEVVTILTEADYWNDAKAWRSYGDRSRNWATIGGQQSKPDHALVEKLTNAIDTKLIAAALIKNQMDGPSAPTSIFEARNLLFGEQLKDMESLSKSITVAATGRRQRPSITITDDGEGVTPSGMPKTILSLHEGNKDQIRFVQGKFNMGGSGVLEFCGIEHNVQLVLSRRNPELLPKSSSADDRKWCFTIVRREDPPPDSPSSTVTQCPSKLRPSGTSKYDSQSCAISSAHRWAQPATGLALELGCFELQIGGG